jgi:hypothetical protein
VTAHAGADGLAEGAAFERARCFVLDADLVEPVAQEKVSGNSSMGKPTVHRTRSFPNRRVARAAVFSFVLHGSDLQIDGR